MMYDSELDRVEDALRDNHPDTAAGILTEILANHPDHPRAGWLMLQCMEQKRDRQAALSQLERLLQLASNNLAGIHQLAEWAYQNAHPMDAVLTACREYIANRPGSADAVFNLASYLALDQQYEAAIETYREAIRLGIRAPEEAEMNIASIFMDRLGDPGKAAQHLRKARGLNPRSAAVYYNMGNLAEQLGDRPKATRYFEKCLEMDPGNDPVLARLADTHRFETAEDPLLKRMVVAALTSTSRDLHFSLGRAYDRLADYDKAWRHFSAANAMDAGVFPPYQAEQVVDMFDRIGSVCSTDWLARFAGPSPAPVFICGLFRTGTTLLEQILGAHPSFTPGGESEFFPRLLARQLPFYPEGLTGLAAEEMQAWRTRYEAYDQSLTHGASRLTDKRPDNFLYAGLIAAMLPNARFIITERDPRDTAVSLFGTRLGARQNYATRLDHIRHYLEQHRKLVDHWEDVLGERLIRVRYEDLVQQPRETVENLLHWLGESWDDNCLLFHEQSSAVRTASVWQVRKPLHTGSVGRWRNYSKPVEEAFGS